MLKMDWFLWGWEPVVSVHPDSPLRCGQDTHDASVSACSTTLLGRWRNNVLGVS